MNAVSIGERTACMFGVVFGQYYSEADFLKRMPGDRTRLRVFKKKVSALLVECRICQAGLFEATRCVRENLFKRIGILKADDTQVIID